MCPPSCFTGAHHSSHCVQLTVSLLPSSSSSSSSFSFSPNLTWLNPWTVITSLATTPLVTEGPIILFLLFSSLSSGTTASSKGPCSIVLCIRYLAWTPAEQEAVPYPHHHGNTAPPSWESYGNQQVSGQSHLVMHIYVCTVIPLPLTTTEDTTPHPKWMKPIQCYHMWLKEVCRWQCNFPLTLGWS